MAALSLADRSIAAGSNAASQIRHIQQLYRDSVLDPYGRLPILDSTIGTLVLSGGAPKTEGSSRIKVCSSGCEYTDFKSAIDAAIPGETIDVAEGTYTEDINITKPLWFRSEGEGVRYEGMISSNGFPVTFESESGNNFAAVNLYPKGVQDEILGLKDPDSDVRFVSLMVLARENDSRAIEPMTSLLYDENEHLRVAAAEVLLNMGVRGQSAKGVALYLTGRKKQPSKASMKPSKGILQMPMPGSPKGSSRSWRKIIVSQ